MASQEFAGNISIWWFPRDFSQSRFGEYQQSGTNSCTLISLILADKIAKEENGFLRDVNELPRRAFAIFSAAINAGNAAYNRVFGTVSRAGSIKKSNRQNLSVPDAMRMLRSQSSLGFYLQEWFFTHLHANPTNNEEYMYHVATQLGQIFTVGVGLFRQPSSKYSEKHLFAALIADSRTVCFVFEFPNNLVSIFDSHQHGRATGALIAQASLSNITELLYWFTQMQFDIYGSKPSLYEVSFLTIGNSSPPHPRKHDETRSGRRRKVI